MSKKYDSLGDRMKGYENIARNYLTRRIPTIIRVDGKAFHTFTRGMEKPFDRILMTTMQNTMKYLCENIQGCVFGYTQSDEITLILVDYKKLTSSAWFDYNGCMVRIQHPKDVQRFRFNGYACFFKCLCCRAVEELS